MAAVRAHVNLIEAAKAKHRQIDVVILAGNHDPDFSSMLSIALVFKYEGDERVTVHFNPSKMWVYEHGTTMLCAHHGDKTKPERLVQQAADVHAPIWGRTYWRYLDTGHIHSDTAKDIGGMKFESHRAITSLDAAAAAFGYTGRSTMKCIIVHRERGEVMRHTAAIG
jgi:DNA repair exonuclease SbcCD nuclease subunit